MRAIIGNAVEAHIKAPVPIDVPRLITSRLLIQGNSGAGKSHTVRRLLEQTHGQAQHLVLDPDGEYASLRERFAYVLVAKHGGDCVADPRSAGLLARKLLECGASAIMDLYELQAHQRILFARNFLDALVNAPKNLWHPALVVVDEAHVFCPQVGSAESSGAVIDLATRGRKRGYCLVAATQRISKLHKDVAAECNNKLIGRAALDVDMKRCADELGFSGRTEQHELRKLKAGQFWAFGPAMTDVPLLVQVGEVKTTHAKAGKRTKPTATPAAIKQVLKQLTDIPKEAEEEVRSLADAKAKIRELETKLRAQPKPKVERVIEKTPQPFVSEKRAKDLSAKLSAVSKATEQLNTLLEAFNKDAKAHATQRLRTQAASVLVQNNVPALQLPAKPQPKMRVEPAPTKPVQVCRIDAEDNAESLDGKLTPARRRMLDAIAWWNAMGKERPSRLQLGLILGVSSETGGFANNLGALRSSGLIDYPESNKVTLTEEGRTWAQAPEVASITQLYEQIRAVVSPAQWRMLEAIKDADQEGLSRAELGAALGVSEATGGFANNLGRLRTLELIDYPTKGHVKATPLLLGQIG